ncbi:serine/threonine-protein kinase pim-1-like [Poecile atricapillus]|uniref:serine/threonine-protein kinase pim-1-like n=1 Tax=Poecile atricapillus TaxID=48891 RepID=UPI002739EBD6|nr:serine/threonine-protein kinase pim-1-like [Poecile atricapillus]
MPPARPWPRPRPRPRRRRRPRASRLSLALARLRPSWRWRFWAGLSAWGWGGITALWLRLLRALPRPWSRPLPRLLPGPAEDTGGNAHKGPKERYRVGSLLGCGGFGSVFAATRLSDGAPVAIKKVPRDRIRRWGELPDGTRAPLEIVLMDRVSSGCAAVIQLLEWLELPDSFLLVLERPQRCQDLSHLLAERRFLPEEEARGLFCQVLEAVQHCTSCGVLHRDIKPENILLDLATGQVKLIDFGCGTFLQDTAYTRFAGTLSYSPPEWFYQRCYHGQAATIWSLGLLLYQLVTGKHPFRKGQQIVWGQIIFPRRLSQECQDVIKRCLSMQPLDRPSLEDLCQDPWIQGVHLP